MRRRRPWPPSGHRGAFVTDRRLMLVHLREREAFGRAMAHDAATRDRRASVGWQQYVMTVESLREELESEEPDAAPNMGIPIPVQECRDGHDGKTPIYLGRVVLDEPITGNPQWRNVEYMFADVPGGALARFGNGRPWFEVKASDIMPRDGEE